MFASATQSTSTTCDTITDLNASVDKIDLSFTVSGFDGMANGSVSTASFDANVAAAVNSVIGPNVKPACFMRMPATLSSHDFLIIDGNANGSYDAGLDYVIDITNFSGTIAVGPVQLGRLRLDGALRWTAIRHRSDCLPPAAVPG